MGFLMEDECVREMEKELEALKDDCSDLIDSIEGSLKRIKRIIILYKEIKEKKDV